MLHLFSTGIIPLWLNTAGILADPVVPKLSLLDLLQFNVVDNKASNLWQTYIASLPSLGLTIDTQGVWLQTQDQLLMEHNALQPLPAASLTKVVTSLAALKTWGPHHTFKTDVKATGPIINGVLQGDLVIIGGGDPLFVGLEAISMAHSLNQMGIQKVSGNLVIAGAFSMDFLADPIQSGERLRQGFNGYVSQPTIESNYTQPPQPPTLKPTLDILGSVQRGYPQSQSHLLLRHTSLPMYALLKQMNVNSNNALAESLATEMDESLVSQVKAATDIPAREILVLNGSGLGQDNRLSPRAVVALLQRIHQELQTHQLTLADIFPVANRDLGTIEDRHLPTHAIVKTGTLWNVSALAGVIPTQKLGPVWFAMINRGDNIDGFRQDQDRLLQQLTQHLGIAPGSIPELTPSRPTPVLGDLSRNQRLTQSP